MSGRAGVATSTQDDELQPASDYACWARPHVARLLGAIRLDVVFHRGAGDYLYYRDGRGKEIEVLDLVGGFGASLFGHNHPDLVRALRGALSEGRPFNAQGSIRSVAGALARKLSEMVGRHTGRRYVTTTANSGAEAVEAALKHAELEHWQRVAAIARQNREMAIRLRAEAKQHPLAGELNRIVASTEALLEERPIALAVAGAFHGKTLGALKLTANPLFREPWKRDRAEHFIPLDDEGVAARVIAAAQVPYQELIAEPDGRVHVRERSASRICGVFVEPIQGEGGIREVRPSYAACLRRLADEHGFPLVFDESQTGMGRTGRFLASEALGVAGDYYILAKALGGGLTKTAAVMIDRRRYVDEFGYVHTSTFADDDLSSSVGLAALGLLDADGGALLETCREKGAFLLERLGGLQRRYPEVLEEVRGRGLMIGLEFRSAPAGSPSRFIQALYEQRLLVLMLAGHYLHDHRIRVLPALSAPFALRLEPSAYVSREELQRFVDATESVLGLLRAGNVTKLARFAFESEDVPAEAAAAAEAAEAQGAFPQRGAVG